MAASKISDVEAKIIAILSADFNTAKIEVNRGTCLGDLGLRSEDIPRVESALLEVFNYDIANVEPISEPLANQTVADLADKMPK